MKIGVFDSGIGGLTVLKEIMYKLPKFHYIYYGDTLHLPYGDKTKQELLKLVSKIIDFFIKEKVDLILIACGTVSSTIYDELCNLYSIKILNIINSTIEKIETDKIQDIVVLATTRTINSHVFSNSLENIKVTEIACPKFVPLLEKNIGNKDNILDEYLRAIKLDRKNNIVLGCTHYPLLQKDIEKYLGYKVNFYNMGKIIAEKITDLNLINQDFMLEMYFSLIDDNLLNNVKRIIDVEYKIEQIVL